MNQAIRELFAHAARHVTVNDVADFCPSDPGYADYVRTFGQILSNGTPPDFHNFDITETINLTVWSDPAREKDEVRFRRFRSFTNAVGIALLMGADRCECMTPNYLAIRLIEDAHALQDEPLLCLLPSVFTEAHDHIASDDWVAPETPFLSLGRLIVTCLGHGPQGNIPLLADQVIAEADQHAGHASNEFFWGCSHFNQLQDRWRHFVKLSFPADASNDSVAALRDALLL